MVKGRNLYNSYVIVNNKTVIKYNIFIYRFILHVEENNILYYM